MQGLLPVGNTSTGKKAHGRTIAHERGEIFLVVLYPQPYTLCSPNNSSNGIMDGWALKKKNYLKFGRAQHSHSTGGDGDLLNSGGMSKVGRVVRKWSHISFMRDHERHLDCPIYEVMCFGLAALKSFKRTEFRVRDIILWKPADNVQLVTYIPAKQVVFSRHSQDSSWWTPKVIPNDISMGKAARGQTGQGQTSSSCITTSDRWSLSKVLRQSATKGIVFGCLAWMHGQSSQGGQTEHTCRKGTMERREARALRAIAITTSVSLCCRYGQIFRWDRVAKARKRYWGCVRTSMKLYHLANE